MFQAWEMYNMIVLLWINHIVSSNYRKCDVH